MGREIIEEKYDDHESRKSTDLQKLWGELQVAQNTKKTHENTHRVHICVASLLRTLCGKESSRHITVNADIDFSPFV